MKTKLSWLIACAIAVCAVHVARAAQSTPENSLTAVLEQDFHSTAADLLTGVPPVLTFVIKEPQSHVGVKITASFDQLFANPKGERFLGSDSLVFQRDGKPTRIALRNRAGVRLHIADADKGLAVRCPKGTPIVFSLAGTLNELPSSASTANTTIASVATAPTQQSLFTAAAAAEVKRNFAKAERLYNEAAALDPTTELGDRALTRANVCAAELEKQIRERAAEVTRRTRGY